VCVYACVCVCVCGAGCVGVCVCVCVCVCVWGSTFVTASQISQHKQGTRQSISSAIAKDHV